MALTSDSIYRILLIAWALIIPATCLGQPVLERDLPPPAKALPVNRAVVMMLGYNKKTGGHQQATGFFIDRTGKVATSYHAIAGMDSIKVWNKDSGGFPVSRIIAIDVAGDLAIVAVDIPVQTVIHPARIADTLPKPGESIELIGHPLGHPQTRSQGIVTSLFPAPPIKTLIQFSMPITDGESGSPLFDASGQVVGIAAFILYVGESREQRYFAIPATRLQRLLRQPQSS